MLFRMLPEGAECVKYVNRTIARKLIDLTIYRRATASLEKVRVYDYEVESTIADDLYIDSEVVKEETVIARVPLDVYMAHAEIIATG